MTHRSRQFTAVCLLLAATLIATSPALRGQAARLQQIAAVTPAELRAWDSQVNRMIRARELQLRLDREDTLIAGRRHTRYTQLVNGVPVYGADIARQTDEKGL